MLVLGRKVGQTIAIDGGRIAVTVLSIEEGRVQLGVDAPEEVAIHRLEVQRRINKEKACESAKR